MNKSIVVACLVLFVLLVACSPSPAAIEAAIVQTQAAWTPVPTQTPLPTYTPAPTYTPVPTIAVIVTRTILEIVLVTPTYTPTPLYTPTNTSTPTDTPPPTQTPNATQTAQAEIAAKLVSPKGNGFYIVNIDIAPGVWRSTGTGDDCYWQRSTKTGGIIDNHYGMAGGTIYIARSDFQIEFNGCGIWEYIGN